MIVFALMMGVSFTSCMGESDPTVSPVATLKVVSTYPYTFQYPNDGLKIVASNTSELLTDNSVNLGLGDIIFLQYTYNSEEQPLTSETKEITAKVTIGHNCTSGNTSIGVPVENNGAGEPYENATIVELLPAGQGTMYYDKNTLLLGVTLYGEKGQIQNEKIKINILKDGTLDIGNSFWAAADQIKFKGSEQYLLLPENENDLKIIDIMSDMTDSFESSGYHFKTGPVVEFRNLEHIHAQTHI